MRAFGAALAIVVLASQSAAAADLDSAFYIMRKGVPIGYHIVDVEETEDGVSVETRIEMRVKFGPFPVFRYRHIASEFWRDGELQFMSTTTDDNGEESAMAARREDGALMIEGNAFTGPAPQDAWPSSYWNKTVIGATMLLNTQNGELIDIDVAALGNTVGPHGMLAEHYRLVGTLALDLWYEGERWVGSNFTIEGEELTYQLVTEGEERQRLFARLE